jgi:hypothetical protein
MKITNDMMVTMYRFGGNEFLKSAHSNFETLIEDQPLVAYSTELGYLFQSVEAFEYSNGRFVQDMMHQDGIDMTYGEYVKFYKNDLNKKHVDAPVLNDVYASQHSNVPEELRPVSAFDRLTKLGINFKIG